VRIALGATVGNVSRLVLRQGLSVAAVGIVLGLALALAAGKVLASVLYGVSPRDPLVLAGAAGVLLAAAALASWLPARRAARVDPVMALRSE
jgi:ABC-type antimicrobial peptide transport system permease subunit